MRDFINKTTHIAGRAWPAGLFLALLIAATVQCDKKEKAVPMDKVDQQVQDIRKEYLNVSKCKMCRKEATGKTICQISVSQEEKAKTCCARCGVMMLRRLGYEKGGSTVCYSTGQRVDLRKAYYVVNSDVKICCDPSTLAFYSQEEAEKFVEVHHGEIKMFKDI